MLNFNQSISSTCDVADVVHCKSFPFLLVNLIAVSLHCSNYIGKTSHHLR